MNTAVDRLVLSIGLSKIDSSLAALLPEPEVRQWLANSGWSKHREYIGHWSVWIKNGYRIALPSESAVGYGRSLRKTIERVAHHEGTGQLEIVLQVLKLKLVVSRYDA